MADYLVNISEALVKWRRWNLENGYPMDWPSEGWFSISQAGYLSGVDVHICEDEIQASMELGFTPTISTQKVSLVPMCKPYWHTFPARSGEHYPNQGKIYCYHINLCRPIFQIRDFCARQVPLDQATNALPWGELRSRHRMDKTVAGKALDIPELTWEICSRSFDS